MKYAIYEGGDLIIREDSNEVCPTGGKPVTPELESLLRQESRTREEMAQIFEAMSVEL